MGDGPLRLDRPVEDYLSAFEVRRTLDFESMWGGMQTVFPTPATSMVPTMPHEASPAESTLHAARLSDLTIGVVHVGTDVRAHVGPMPDYQVVVALSGGVVGHFASRVVEVGPMTASVNAPGECALLPRWAAHTRLLMIRIRPSAVARELTELVGHAVTGQLRFEYVFSLESPRAGSWLQAVGLLVTELSEPGSLARSSARHRNQLERLVISSLLRATENEFSGSLRTDHRPPRWVSVRRAIEAMQGAPERHWTVPEMAEIAGVSGRRVQQAFLEQLGVSPMTYLQRLRLEGARGDLLDDTGFVADVSARWGFGHLGRFAAAYRAHFGESPSETRRRSRTILIG